MYKEIHVMEDQRKFLQSKMSESENWENIFQHYYDNIPAYIYLKDTESNYIFINKKCEELFNITREELAKRKYSDFDFFNAEMAEQLQKNDKLVMESGKHIETEETGKPEGKQNVRLKAGYRFYFALKFPLLDSGGNTIGVCGFSHDITKQKQLEEKLKTANKKLLAEINERKQAEDDLRETTHNLGERVKELNCMYGISKLIEKENISVEKILQGTADIIPPSWQYPKITCAQVKLDGQSYRTKTFKETEWHQSQEIIVHGEKAGAVEIYYLEEKPEIDEGPFLKEERLLINAIAERLGHIAERYRAVDEVKILKGIIPICSYCKEIRDDKGFWNRVEAYIENHTEASFSHGICPDCLKIEMEKFDIEE